MPIEMNRTNYNGRIHEKYQEARRLLPETGRLWMDMVRRFVDATKDLTVLDLGSGTGRFSVLLADALHARVIAVEPSDKMRAVAMRDNTHTSVRYVKGSAEEIPLQDGSCDILWTSMVVHHISRLDRAAAEIHRVLRPEGKVFIRNSFKNRLDSTRFYEFFPSALAIDNERLPSVESVKRAFEQNGFQLEHFDAVQQVIDRTFKDHVERIRKRGLSTFELISDEEFQAGLRLMEKTAETEDPSREVTEKIDFMVFSRPPDK
jgi:ubiquinone/menaquinone biosynthesis C-methylase UbiE